MGLIYRSLFSVPREQLPSGIRTTCAKWLAEQGCDVDLAVAGDVSVGELDITVAQASEDDLEAFRLVASREKPAARSVTAVTAVADEDTVSVWVDLEHTTHDPFAGLLRIEPPRVMSHLVNDLDCKVGNRPLSVSPTVYAGQEGGSAVATAITDPDRTLPVIVVAQDRWETIEEACDHSSLLLGRLLGWADVVVVDSDGTMAVRDTLGEDRTVAPGAARLYMPVGRGFGSDGRDVTVPATILRKQPVPSSIRFQQVLATPAVAQALPALYTGRVAKMPGFPRFRRGSVDAESLLEELIEMEGQQQAMLKTIEEKESQLLDSLVEQDDIFGQLTSAENRIQFLEGRLRDLGEYNLFQPVVTVEEADSCVDAIELANQTLSLVNIGDTKHNAQVLDGYPQSSVWGKKAWVVFRSMQSFAEAKQAGDFQGSFRDFQLSDLPGVKIAVHMVAMKEDESTDGNPECRQARVFPVDAAVHSDEQVYMDCHVKITKGGRPAPRIHFHDDTRGETGMVWVGYFGAHLPTE